jgi:carboxypeptidase Q
MKTPRFALWVFLLAALAPAQDRADLALVHRLKQEAYQNSQVMDHLFYLTDVHGPRLTGSPGFQRSADWAVKRLQGWGLSNVTQEKWGPFGRGWSASRFAAHLVEPEYAPLIGVPLEWTPSTNGTVVGEPILTPLRRETDPQRDEAALEKFFADHKGKLKGRIILLSPSRNLQPQTSAAARRFSSEELTRQSRAPEPILPAVFDYEKLEIPEDAERRRQFLAHAPEWFNEEMRQGRRRRANRLNQFLAQEGVTLVVRPASVGDGGTIFPPSGGSRYVEDPVPPPSIALTPEHYNRLVRLIEKNIPARIEVDVRTRFHQDTLDSINVIAEIPGGAKRDEIVMLGAHLDSWTPGTGATDNAAGCAVMIEAVRLLKTLNLPLERTVRLALWGGEEQGLLGSRAYVKRHFGDPETMHLTPEHARFAGYFNFDNGTGKIRGVYLQGNDMVRPIFSAWLAPFQDWEATSLSIRNTGGTDHLSFDEVGLPGFQFIQDPVEYSSRTHHSNMDVYDRIVPADLVQASVIIASFVYHAANRPEMLPRKPLPQPRPKTRPKASTP